MLYTLTFTKRKPESTEPFVPSQEHHLADTSKL